MKTLEHLDLSSSMMEDDTVEMVACIRANLRNVNLSNKRVSSAGVEILAGHLPNLEILSLSGTPIDDYAISYVSMMILLKGIDLSNTEIKGFIQQVGGETDLVLSLSALQNLVHLERLNLEQTQVKDATLCPISTFKELSYFSLRSASLTDVSLDHFSSLSKLTNLGIRDAVLKNGGLGSFKPQATLKLLDLHGGWLLTEYAILQSCKMHPRIEVRRDLVHISPSYQVGSNCPSPSRTSLKPSLVNKKQDQIPLSDCFLGSDGSTIIFSEMRFHIFEYVHLTLFTYFSKLIKD